MKEKLSFNNFAWSDPEDRTQPGLKRGGFPVHQGDIHPNWSRQVSGGIDSPNDSVFKGFKRQDPIFTRGKAGGPAGDRDDHEALPSVAGPLGHGQVL